MSEEYSSEDIIINCTDGTLSYSLYILKIVSKFFHDLDDSVKIVNIPFTLDSMKVIVRGIVNRLKEITSQHINIQEINDICDVYALQNYLTLTPPLIPLTQELLQMANSPDKFQKILDHTPIASIMNNHSMFLAVRLRPPNTASYIELYFEKYIKENKSLTGCFSQAEMEYNWSLIYAWCLLKWGQKIDDVIKIIKVKHLSLDQEAIIHYIGKIMKFCEYNTDIKKKLYKVLVTNDELHCSITFALFADGFKD